MSLTTLQEVPRSVSTHGEASIAVKDLRYRVAHKEVLRGINLQVLPGEILCVMGMSGCGKTTLMHCIGGLTLPTSGEIWIGDTQIVGMNEDALNRVRERMGMVFQYAALFDSLSVYENVAFGLRRRRHMSEEEIKQSVCDKLSIVGLPDTENLFPSELSGGMAKRVGLARAIAMAPEILLYDEPTSGLDPVVASVIDELIMQMRDRLGVTSIVVSHNLPSVFRIADKIAMLHEGQVLVFGTPDEVKACTNPIVQQFIQGQSHGPIEVVHR
jgi:phospholipid/cholesterol/gamma-HCH transport system ATP-binding protein